MEYVQRLVELGYLDSSAVQLVQEQRDAPTHGVMLRPAGSDSTTGPAA
jgi:Fe2+ transport system protein FeoA